MGSGCCGSNGNTHFIEACRNESRVCVLVFCLSVCLFVDVRARRFPSLLADFCRDEAVDSQRRAACVLVRACMRWHAHGFSLLELSEM